jgi:hypothetical protein
MVPGAFEEAPPGQIENCILDGVCGNSYMLLVVLRVSSLFKVLMALPSIDQVIESSVQSIS